MLPRLGTGRWSRSAVCLSLVCALGLSSGTQARAGFTTGIDSDGLFDSDDQGEARRWFDTTTTLNAGMVRLDLGWSSVASRAPANPADPADPAYDFSELDRAVEAAAARHLQVMLTLSHAPVWAQRGGGGGGAEGAWKPDPDALGSFARAVAKRYSGRFKGLPHVRYFDAWNEANLDIFLAPQYDEDGRPVAVARYRRMVNAVDRAVSSVDRDNQVIVGSLAPYGDDPGGGRTRPLTFLRKLLCLTRKLKATACPTKTHVDIFSHHPINLSGGPRASAIDRDDAPSADLGSVRRVLRAAERAGTIAGKQKRHPLWVTEFWWESFPDGPDPATPSLRKHGRWIEEALYLFWQAGAQAAIYYSLADRPLDHPDNTLQAGLYLNDGTPKPAATAFRFPFVTERKSRTQVLAWGKAPTAGKLRIERKGSRGWSKINAERVEEGQVFATTLRVRGTATLRARLEGQRSLPWTQHRG
jgi:hypothetical protein